MVLFLSFSQEIDRFMFDVPLLGFKVLVFLDQNYSTNKIFAVEQKKKSFLDYFLPILTSSTLFHISHPAFLSIISELLLGM